MSQTNENYAVELGINPTKTHYIVQAKRAKMPTSCWGNYMRVAVLEVPVDVFEVSMISERSRDVVKVVETWERLNVGTTERCAYQRALTAATAMAEELNAS